MMRNIPEERRPHVPVYHLLCIIKQYL